MKSTGIVRQVDDIGRIVISKELRKTIDIKRKDPLGIFVKRNNIYSKYKRGCLFCEEIGDIFEFKEVTI